MTPGDTSFICWTKISKHEHSQDVVRCYSGIVENNTREPCATSMRGVLFIVYERW